ncbi:MAG: bifunctional adenosylcobinamide kinase/adenosylcobinamide-phosphate guanylyltransferase [Gemmatimonadales bacterium]|nr:bifunctional adenosylcobinamide kinase/adenosylcobinamide-phosphate guanylyltransferase [Candidatus Palauibacter denitrificans]MYE94000.1 bifunctional adenosylcobinamide kinase/adenosylcobinamide-phosphate guanylyltransferase [Gemmatimonadota bacterium]
MMELILVTGGVRSGKSRWAQGEALARGGGEVTVIATAEAVDDEMRDRIEAHRRDRPAGWHTIEAPARAGEAIVAAGTDTVLLDCVTVLTGMAIGRSGAGSEAAALDAMAAEIDGILDARAARAGVLIVVTNEVGWSVHPPTALGRWYQDGIGVANQRLAAAADRVVLMVSGLDLQLK